MVSGLVAHLSEFHQTKADPSDEQFPKGLTNANVSVGHAPLSHGKLVRLSAEIDPLVSSAGRPFIRSWLTTNTTTADEDKNPFASKE
jgi:hypothetical protein